MFIHVALDMGGPRASAARTARPQHSPVGGGPAGSGRLTQGPAHPPVPLGMWTDQGTVRAQWLQGRARAGLPRWGGRWSPVQARPLIFLLRHLVLSGDIQPRLLPEAACLSGVV